MRITFRPWGETLAELADAAARAEERAPRCCGCRSCTAAPRVTAAALITATSSARVGTSIRWPSPAAR